MSYKEYNLDYMLEIQGRDGTLYRLDGTIDESLTIEYNITKTYTSEANTCSIAIYNLNQTIRNNIKKTKLDRDIRGVTLSIGFNKNLSVVFAGTIKECNSTKNNENFKTEIIGWDGGEAMLYSETNVTLMDNVNLYHRLVSDLPSIRIGYITPKANYKINAKRGQVLSGKTWNILKEYQNNFQMFIDNQQLYILDENETLDYFYNITTENGILNMPKDLGGTIELELMAEPSIKLKGKVSIKLTGDKTYNGDYIIIKINQVGNISKIGEKNEWKTILELQKNLINNKTNNL